MTFFNLLPLGLYVAQILSFGIQETSAAYTNPNANLIARTNDEKAPSAHPLPAEQFYRFENGSIPENIAIRKNGKLLVTLNTSPDLYQINPHNEQDGTLLHSFPEYNALFGITEIEHDVFYLIAGNWTNAPDYQGEKGSWGVWSIDFRSKEPSYSHCDAHGRKPKIHKVMDVPDATLLDGLTVLNSKKGLMVTGDSRTGALYVIDTRARKSRKVFQDDKLAGKNKDGKGTDAFGINGMKVRNRRLYFTNASKGYLATLAIELNTGKVAQGAKVTIEGKYDTFIDEFVFDDAGNIYMAADMLGLYYLPAKSRKSYELLVKLPGLNSCAFGRSRTNAKTLYVTTGFSPQGISRVKCTTRGRSPT